MSKLEQKTKAKADEKKTHDNISVLTGDDVLQADQLRAVPVVTHEWKPNTRAFVCEMSAEERDEFETEWIAYRDADEDGNVGFRAFSVAWCMCDENRIRLFAANVAHAADILQKKNGKATARLFNTISRMNGLTKADIDALEKN